MCLHLNLAHCPVGQVKASLKTIFERLPLYLCVCVCECIHVCMCVSACVRAFVCVCMWACIGGCAHMCMCAYGVCAVSAMSFVYPYEVRGWSWSPL